MSVSPHDVLVAVRDEHEAAGEPPDARRVAVVDVIDDRSRK